MTQSPGLFLRALLLCCAFLFTTNAAADLFMSEYIEGSSFNKAIEIFNGTGASVDLAAGVYTLELYSNGSPTVSQSVALTGTLANGDVFVVAHASANAGIQAQTDLQSTAVANFNGNDALVLKKNGVVIDSFGQVGTDPGSQWTGGGLNDTLRRKTAICTGDTVTNDAFDASVEWDIFAEDTIDGLGSHTATCVAVPPTIVINEADADTPGTDVAEFIELYDGGVGNTALDGHVLVLFNGSDDASYESYDLDGETTNGDGYFVLCGEIANVANCDVEVGSGGSGFFQNGADAVALFTGDAADFPNDTPVTTTDLLDALVYDTSDSDDAGLLPLLNAGQPQINENEKSAGATESNQRCPNGSGGQRNTDTYEQWTPTPGAENICLIPLPAFVCGNEVTPIHNVQGNGAASPIAGTIVDVEAIVVGVFQGGGTLGGIFLQEEDADADADPMTSEGLFAFTATPAAIGDHVRVRGTVVEYFDLTELSPVSDLAVCSSGNTLPTPAQPSLPMASADAFEPYEGMSVDMGSDLIVNDVFSLWRYGEFTVSSIARYTPTAVVAPGAAANALEASHALDALTVDDGRTQQNLVVTHLGDDDTNPFDATNPIRIGQTMTSLKGVMHYSFGVYRLQPTEPHVIDETANPRTAAPASVGGSLKVSALNVLNFFSTIDSGPDICGPAANQDCRGADSASELTKQTTKIVAALSAMDADVVGLIEIENNTDASLIALVNALNASVGAGTYDFINTGTIGTDAIKQAIIYKPATVTPVGAFAILDSSVDATFNDLKNRPSLAQTFRANSNLARFNVVVNHLKSKGSNCNDLADPDTGDGQGNCNLTRTAAATALANWVSTDPTGTNTDRVLLLGDLNSYAMEDPIVALETAGMTNLQTAFEGASAYSYTFMGLLGSLDYALANATLLPEVMGAVAWHINSAEAIVLDYNEEFGKQAQYYAPDANRASDHDPVVVGLELTNPSMVTIDTTDPLVDADVTISGGGNSCGFTDIEFADPNSLAQQPPGNLVFPYGVLQFAAAGCDVGSTVTVDVDLPAIPEFLSWYKFIEASGWTVYPSTLNGTTFSIQLTDGGMGDADGVANGQIVDPSGPAILTDGGARATFLVSKYFNDLNPAMVEVTLSCFTGLPLVQSQEISKTQDVEFVVTSFNPFELDCTVSETEVEGYTASYEATPGYLGLAGSIGSSDSACIFEDVADGQFVCAITNSLDPVEVTVNKEWVVTGEADIVKPDVYVELFCSKHKGAAGSAWINTGKPGVIEVYPSYLGETCFVTETPLDGSVEIDVSDCKAMNIEPGTGDSCIVVNTVFFEGIPTLNQWGLALLAMLMLGVAAVNFRRFA